MSMRILHLIVYILENTDRTHFMTKVISSPYDRSPDGIKILRHSYSSLKQLSDSFPHRFTPCKTCVAFNEAVNLLSC